MLPEISLTRRTRQVEHLILILEETDKLPAGLFTSGETDHIRKASSLMKQDPVVVDRMEYLVFICFIKTGDSPATQFEKMRRTGEKSCEVLNRRKADQVYIFDEWGYSGHIFAFTEGLVLGNYQFLKYRTSGEGLHTLRKIGIYSGAITAEEISVLRIQLESVYLCRDLVNEPVSVLNASRLAERIREMGEAAGAGVEVMNRKKIEALKMGGLLGVNQGSCDPPSFIVMEYKPVKPRNTKPLVLVGKGVVYDTGGVNLKPGASMTSMKNDMAGGAVVAAVITAIAKAGMPVHVAGLIPATDNRIGPKSMVPGDILHMHNGTTVEVVDTDAEGRLILADALSYARRFDPMLVIDLATLTGSAVRAIGQFAAVAMHAGSARELSLLGESGNITGEKIWEFPMWEEYAELIKSEIADLKNLGPPEAGAITAAKFLEKFVTYPWIHLDIAGPAYTEKRDSYRGLGGTGYGVRLLFNFVQKI